VVITIIYNLSCNIHKSRLRKRNEIGINVVISLIFEIKPLTYLLSIYYKNLVSIV